FSNLQGLRAVPISLYLVVICLWTNGIHGPARDFLIPALGLAITVILLFVIDQYYRYTFGRVQRTTESRRLEWLVSAIGGIVALGAFWLDNYIKLPVSLVGLVFSISLLADYIRITWLVKGRFLLYYPIGAILLAVVSVLPLLGVPNWWLAFGIRSQLLGICIAFGIYAIIAGIWGHIFLVQTLSQRVVHQQ
ncbi:MAG TPA: hypothetical protein VF338_02020, partial [Leptolinea sp.]